MRRMNFMTSENGSTALEFALVAPVFFLLLFGIIEFSLIMFTKSVMEGATGMTSRLGKTGYSETGLSRQQTLINMLTDQSHGILASEKIVITTLIYKNFNSIGTPEPYTDTDHNGHWDSGETYTDVNGNGMWDDDMGKAGLGSAGDIVIYKVHYPWPVKTPVMRQFLGDNDGNMPLDVNVVVRNEPYENIY
jgi:Flp pilus assembly pilin Flp